MRARELHSVEGCFVQARRLLEQITVVWLQVEGLPSVPPLDKETTQPSTRQPPMTASLVSLFPDSTWIACHPSLNGLLDSP